MLVKTLDGKILLGVRLWRLFLQAGGGYASLRSGGCMVERNGRRVLARPFWGRLCWIRD